MTQRTLGQIVSGAFAEHDLHQKVASVRTTEIAPIEEDFLADELGLLEVKVAADEGDEDEKKKKDMAKEDKADKTAGILDNASYAKKLAMALNSAAAVVTKLAQAEAPAVTESGHDHGATISPKAQTPGGSAIAMQNGAKGGPQGSLPTDAHEAPKSAAAEKIAESPEATQRLLNTKIAEYRMFASMGHTEAAKTAKAQAEELHAKIANGAGGLAVSSGGEGSHVPDNAGMASLTKGQARDSNTREAGTAFGIAPKHDNAVAAHVGRTDGLKVSSLKALLGKGDRVLQAVGGKALDSGAKAAKNMAGAAENRLFNGPAVGKVKDKALSGAIVHGHNAAQTMGNASGSEGARRAVGAGIAGVGAGAGAMAIGKKKEAKDDSDFDKKYVKGHRIAGGVLNGAVGAALGAGTGKSTKAKVVRGIAGAAIGGAGGAALGGRQAKKNLDWADRVSKSRKGSEEK